MRYLWILLILIAGSTKAQVDTTYFWNSGSTVGAGPIDDAYTSGSANNKYKNYGGNAFNYVTKYYADGEYHCGFALMRIDSLADKIPANHTITSAKLWCYVDGTSTYDIVLRYCLKSWIEGTTSAKIQDGSVCAAMWSYDATPLDAAYWELDTTGGTDPGRIMGWSCFGDTDYTGHNTCSTGYSTCGIGGCYPFGSVIDSVQNVLGSKEIEFDLTDYAAWAYANDTSVNIVFFKGSATSGSYVPLLSSGYSTGTKRPKLTVIHEPTTTESLTGNIKAAVIKGDVTIKGD